MVPVTFIYGPGNSGAVVEYRILHDVDGNLVPFRDWTTSNIVETFEGSGTYVVLLPHSDISGHVVESRIQGSSKNTSESFPSMTPDLSVLTTMLVQGDTITMGQGTGSVVFNDVITNGVKGVRDLVVRAFVRNGDTVDWTECVGRHVTDREGRYRLYLDPGAYVISVERNGSQITTLDKIVSE